MQHKNVHRSAPCPAPPVKNQTQQKDLRRKVMQNMAQNYRAVKVVFLPSALLSQSIK